MKGSDKIEMTINIGGELIKLDVDFNDQNSVRDAEHEVKYVFDRLKKAWPDNSDRNILAMTAYQFAKWYQQLKIEQEKTIETAAAKCREIENVLNPVQAS